MKTSSKKTLTALLAAGAMFSSSVFAGPGPKGAVETGRNHTNQSEATIAFGGSKSPKTRVSDSQRSQPQMQSKARLIYSPHGGVLVTL